MLSREDTPEEQHLSLDTMARLRTGHLSVEELHGHVLPHFLSRCRDCREVDAQLGSLKRQAGHWDDLVVVTEASEAPELWRRLKPLPYPEQLRAVEDDEAFQTWGLCRELQRRSREAARQHPRLAAQLANLALAISAHLDEAYHRDWVRDLRALSFAYLGNARRALGELHGAADAFDTASLLRPGTPGYSSLEAEALALEAQLRRDQHRLAEAIALLDRAHEIYAGTRPGAADPETADRHLAGEALVHKAWCLYHLGQLEAASTQLEEALLRVDPARDPHLAFAIRHGQIWSAILLGRVDEAETLLPVARALLKPLAPLDGAELPGGGAETLRLRRAEARIDLAQGEKGPAEQTLREVAHDFLLLDRGVDAALVWLDLAALYLREDAAAALRQLAPELLPVFSASDVQRPHIYTLLLVQQACAAGKLTPELASQLGSTLERDRRPSLGWWSGLGTVLSEATDAPSAT
jgi:tetratricopeptide (TPR) repeat protein